VLDAESLLTADDDVPRTTLVGRKGSAVLAIPRWRFGSLLTGREEIRAAQAWTRSRPRVDAGGYRFRNRRLLQLG
jgi:hypothetical protein